MVRAFLCSVSWHFMWLNDAFLSNGNITHRASSVYLLKVYKTLDVAFRFC